MNFVGPTALHHADMAKFEFFDEKQLRWFNETQTPFLSFSGPVSYPIFIYDRNVF